MALLPKLELRQGQQLVMTPQLQQAIRLLQLSNVELCSFVEAEVERNPLLEAEAAASEPGPQGDAKPRSGDSDGDEGDDREWTAASDEGFPLNGEAQEAAAASGAPALNGAGGDGSGWASVRQRTSNAFGGEESNLEDYVAAGQSLADHLTEQLHVALTDPAERLIGAHLIHMVDETGYLRGDLGELAEKLGAPAGLIDKVLAELQGFDPPGVLARDLAECLALQLKDRNRYDPQIARLLDNLTLLGSHNLAALKRAVGVDAQELADMISEIKGLNPKPGLRFGTVQIQPVLPDVSVRPAHDGSWLVELNNDTLPRVLQDGPATEGPRLSARMPAER
jgi:RNA polymerase sigma-54 factor